MRYLSVCSGIEAATVAWHPLGWTPVGFSEVAEFPSAVLSARFPGVINHGDFTKIDPAAIGPVDLIIGGTPCQSFSISGKRLGLDDPRGNLAIEFLRLARRCGAKWLVWENVAGVLSSNGGRDLGAFLGILGELGYGWAYRVLDAQHFGVPQRRRRIFVVAHLGDWRPAAAVLFEPESLGWDRAPANSQERMPGLAGAADCDEPGAGIWWNGQRVSQTLCAVLKNKQTLPEKQRFSALLVPAWQQCDCCDDFICRIHAGQHVYDCDCPGIDEWANADLSPYDNVCLRFITPLEAERLQGFPDGWTAIHGAADGPRYQAIGNSMAVPVIAWIGKQIAATRNT